MPILRERAQGTRKRVTAGLPSLSPERRFSLTEQQLHSEYQRTLRREVVHNDEVAAHPVDGERKMDDPAAQMGIPLQGERLIGRLKKLNPNLYFERSISDSTRYGCYLLRPDIEGGKEYLVGFEAELNPEFTIIVNDDQGKFKKFIPGWRRVLMRLIRAKIITEAAAFAVFGPPNRDSERWATLVQ